MSKYVIETKNLTKQYGTQKSVANLNIHVQKGRIYGLPGRNGAGKTTTMKMLLGLTQPTSGEVAIRGKPLQANEKKLFSKYSLGMKQRLAIALAVMHDPELLILDEPIRIAELEAKNSKHIRFIVSDTVQAARILERIFHEYQFTIQDNHNIQVHNLDLPIGKIITAFVENSLEVSEANTCLAGYIIAREERDDTLKSIMTIPVSYCNLLWGKLFVCALLSLFLGFVSAVFTIIANLIMGFPGLSITSVLQTFIQFILNCLFLYIAVMPVIAVSTRISNGHMVGTIIAFAYGYGGMFAAGNMTLANIYPITASMGLIQYRSYDSAVHWNMLICLFSMITAVFVFTAKGNIPVKAAKKHKKTITKKG